MLGHIDVFQDGTIHGWHANADGKALIIEIDGRFGGLTRTAVDRPDVVAAGLAQGACGFAFEVPASFIDDQEHVVSVRVAGVTHGRPLLRRLRLSASPANPAAVGSRAAVVCWDLAHNPAGRALVLVQILQKLYDKVDLIGPLFPRFGNSIWAPIASQRDLSTICLTVKSHSDLRALGKKISDIPYDLVYICKPRWPSIYLAACIARASGCQVVLDIDDHEMAFFPAELETRTVDVRQTLSRIQENRAFPFDGDATALCDSLIDHFPARTVSNIALQKRFGGQIVAHARSAQEFDPRRFDRDMMRRSLGYGQSDKVVMFVGTIRRHKGVLTIAKAIAELSDPQIKFCLIGPIDEPAVKTELQALLGDAVAIHQGVPFTSLPSVIVAADLVCLPQDATSRAAMYQMPAKLTDAIAMGVPVIVENLPPFANLAGRAGIIMRDGRPLSLQIAEVLRCPPPASDIRDTFLTDFSTEIVVESFKKFLEVAPRFSLSDHPEIEHAVFGEDAPPVSLVSARAPQVLRRVGRDMVFLWKQNDSGLFGRRADMLCKYLPMTSAIGRVIHFDATISLSALTQLERAASARNTSNGLVYRNVLGRWLGLQDELFVRRHTFVCDDQGRSFMGRSLPKRSELTQLFRDTLKSHGVSEEALLWACPVTFDFEHVVEAHRFGHIMVDLIDDQRAFNASPAHTARLQENYEIVLAAADTVLANCRGVVENFKPLLRAPTYIVSNAAERIEVSHSNRVDLFPGQSVVRIGYVGNLRDRIDTELIAKLAKADPSYRVILVGPTGGNQAVEALARLRNVTLTGPLRYEDANRVAAGFDIAIIPHERSELTSSMNPLKLYLYQALGLPVVTTEVDNLDHANKDVRVARSHDDFLQAVGTFVRRLNGRYARSHIETVYWDAQAEKIARLIEFRMKGRNHPTPTLTAKMKATSI